MNSTNDRHFILGTAGHIDHGKTALVKALTGVDTDRLKEEKARGLTIDLGFAHMGENATIIDVPGHEKFIKNMVAGVSTIDLVLFVVAADDGVMPQTREHLDILNILQVRSGIIVINKIDLVDADWLQLVQQEVRELVQSSFLAEAPLIAVSSATGEGIEALRTTIGDFLRQLPPRHDRGIFWLPVDRSFTMKGFGTVVTGSVLSGTLRSGDFVDILPGGEKARVRGLQKHGKATAVVAIGDRAAINLQGVSTEQIGRGEVLATPGYFSATTRLHAKLRLLPSARNLEARTRVRLHLGTAEIMARATPIPADRDRLEAGEGGYVQFTLEKPAAARRLDPFVLRQYSPAETIGGGVILDAAPGPYNRRDRTILARLRGLEKEEPEELVREQLLGASRGMLTEEALVAATGMARETIQPILQKLASAGHLQMVSKKAFVHREVSQRLQQHVLDFLQEFHQNNPTQVGVRKAELTERLVGSPPPALLQFLLDQMKNAGAIKEIDGFVAVAAHEIKLTPVQKKTSAEILRRLDAQGFAPQSPDELAASLGLTKEAVMTLLGVLIVEKQVVRLDEHVYLTTQRLAEARDKLIDFLREHGEITVPQFKELIAGASRKFALPILNYFDAQEITIREGDVRFSGPALANL